MSFDKLPPETLLEIGQYVDQDGLRMLSSTCRRFMAVFQNKAYSTLDFDETSKSADRVLAVALGPRKQLVRTIRFVPRDPRPHEDETPDQGIKLSDEARQVLGSLYKLPMLYKFQFDFSTWRIDQWDVHFHKKYRFTYTDPGEIIPWRHLIHQSLGAFFQNSRNRGAFSCMEMKALPPIGYFADMTLEPACRRLVQDLETFEISPAVTHNEQDIHSLTRYGLFYSEMNYLLAYLTNVNCLRILATEGTAISLGRIYYSNFDPSTIQWKEVQLSKLKTFELEFSAIGDGLIDFLSRHAQTLERITLRYCFTKKKDDWRRLFQLFIDKQPAQLTDFEVLAYPVRLWRGQDEEEWQRLMPISGFKLLADSKKGDLRQFVVVEGISRASRRGKLQPVESLIGSPLYHVDEAELDESDLIPLWEEVGRLVQRNRKPALV
ncbi:hypothetical protein NW752_008691 [Fusarium irregulare]|uniref:F-box domain-containing protein n=1 Tax=Fusarium irregulare TaxID=2494466 RepID=A0A9W8PWJ7_9HYPO|nr:hypothetical protein NW752_008691 [Fusarium irregulare]KAJ4020625.1 hypothetical protein NW766_002114 [Fusarium irregulare]